MVLRFQVFIYLFAVVRSEAGEFLFTVGPPGHIFETGGTKFEYHVTVEGGNFTERLTTNGTINNSVTIEVGYATTYSICIPVAVTAKSQFVP